MAKEIADSTLLDTWSSSGLKVEPDISKIIEGWQLGEQPPHEYMNWLQNTFGSKLNHILKNGVAQWESTKEYSAGATVQHTGNIWLCKTRNTNSEPTDANSNWKRIITVESLTTVLGGYVSLTGNQTITGAKTFSGLSKTSVGDNALEVITSISDGSAGSFMVSQGVKYGLALNGSETGLETGSFNFQVIDRDLKTVKSMPFSIGINGVVSFGSSPTVPTPITGTQVANKDYVDSVTTLNINALNEKITPENTDNLALQETGGLLKKVSFENLTKLSPNDNRVKTALNANGNAPIYACRAWVNFNGTETVAIRASGNVSSIADNGTGDYTVNFTTNMPDANYCTQTTGDDVDCSTMVVGTSGQVLPSTSSIRVFQFLSDINAYSDALYFNVAIFR